jgi:hypothetical protein
MRQFRWWKLRLVWLGIQWLARRLFQGPCMTGSDATILASDHIT